MAIFGVIQVKGGAGRSTLATNLAGNIGLEGARVALIDCDMPQGTSASWGSLRQAETPIDNLTVATAEDHKSLVATAEHLAQTQDIIVIDGPPRIAEITRATLMLADLCLIPLGTSAAEICATSDLLKTIGDAKDAAKRIDKNIDARIVWDRYRGGTTAGKEMPDAVKGRTRSKSIEPRNRLPRGVQRRTDARTDRHGMVGSHRERRDARAVHRNWQITKAKLV